MYSLHLSHAPSYYTHIEKNTEATELSARLATSCSTKCFICVVVYVYFSAIFAPCSAHVYTALQHTTACISYFKSSELHFFLL